MIISQTSMWFEGWTSLGRVVVMGTLSYVALILLLRISGKRTLSKMNAFDFVITIALGSAFATIVLARDVSLAEGVTALAVLIGLQWLISWLYVRFTIVESVIKGRPQLLHWRGRDLDHALRRERVTPEEVRAAMREANVSEPTSAAAVLETDGSITVVELEEAGDQPVLERVRRD